MKVEVSGDLWICPLGMDCIGCIFQRLFFVSELQAELRSVTTGCDDLKQQVFFFPFSSLFSGFGKIVIFFSFAAD
jgi:hypothetical protein